MKFQSILVVTALLGAVFPQPVGATTILQSSGGAPVAFEADAAADSILAGTPETWASVSDPTASGGRALRSDGVNSTGNAPHSFAQYRIRFTGSGSYYVYYRWRADEKLTGADPFTANSAFLGSQFGSFLTPGDASSFYRTDSNAAQAPADNVYVWHQEPTQVYTVEAADVGSALILTLGTREAGMFFDRFVLSTAAGLTDSQLDAVGNSELDVIPQGGQDNFVAFEADRNGTVITPGTPESWESVGDATATGGSALKSVGVNSTGNAPHSFAEYRIGFASVGTYHVYYRWRADEKLTGADPFTANSAFLGSAFGSFLTPGDATSFVRTDSNAAQAPADNTYVWHEEPSLTYVVDDGVLGSAQTITLGTREAGMYFDRFVLSTTSGLTDSQLDALQNSGVPAAGPKLVKAVGSSTLVDVSIRFTKALDAGSVKASKFTLDGGVGVLGAEVDASDLRLVRLTTSAQTQARAYTVTVNGVADADGNPIALNSTVQFTAWKFVRGWATKEIYYFAGQPNTSLDSLKALAIFPDHPSTVQWVKGFQSNQEPLTDNYGIRLSAVFQPDASDTFSFYVTDDDQAELSLSPDETEANLELLQTFGLVAPPFGAAGTVDSPASLEAGKGYLLRALLRQAGGDVYLNVAAKPASSETDPAELSALSGTAIGTFVNPDLGLVSFDQQPAAQTVPSNQRGRFTVKVSATESPVYYQWRANGQAIPGATRATYVTPVLSTADDGRIYSVAVSVAGRDTLSEGARLSVTSGPAPTVAPYLGVNFVGGGGGGLDGVLRVEDVTGVVSQDHWNNLRGSSFDPAAGTPLFDAAGQETPVTLGANGTETFFTGTIEVGSADGVLLQGHINRLNSPDPLVITLNNVPDDQYEVLVYSAGFQFQATYEQSVGLVGADTYPTYHVRAQASLDYQADPRFKRMTSTDPDARDLGNYVQFDNVRPDASGTFTLSLSPESPSPGNNHLPPVSAVQLVRVLPIVQQPSLSLSRNAGHVAISWTGAANGFVLESSASVGSGASWSVAAGAPNPITAAGSLNVDLPAAGSRYFRLRK